MNDNPEPQLVPGYEIVIDLKRPFEVLTGDVVDDGASVTVIVSAWPFPDTAAAIRAMKDVNMYVRPHRDSAVIQGQVVRDAPELQP